MLQWQQKQQIYLRKNSKNFILSNTDILLGCNEMPKKYIHVKFKTE